jgi:hypothetical protein
MGRGFLSLLEKETPWLWRGRYGRSIQRDWGTLDCVVRDGVVEEEAGSTFDTRDAEKVLGGLDRV